MMRKVTGEGFEAALMDDGEVYIKMVCAGEMIGGTYFPLVLTAEFLATVELALRKLFPGTFQHEDLEDLQRPDS